MHLFWGYKKRIFQKLITQKIKWNKNEKDSYFTKVFQFSRKKNIINFWIFLEVEDFAEEIPEDLDGWLHDDKFGENW